MDTKEEVKSLVDRIDRLEKKAGEVQKDIQNTCSILISALGRDIPEIRRKKAELTEEEKFLKSVIKNVQSIKVSVLTSGGKNKVSKPGTSCTKKSSLPNKRKQVQVNGNDKCADEETFKRAKQGTSHYQTRLWRKENPVMLSPSNDDEGSLGSNLNDLENLDSEHEEYHSCESGEEDEKDNTKLPTNFLEN